MRAFEGDQQFTGQSFVAVAPEGMDPCDLRMAKGDSAVRNLVASRVPMFEFVIESLLKDYSLDTPEGRLQALRRTVPVVAQIRDTPLQTEYARQLAGWVGWPDPNEVIRQVRQEAKNPSNKGNKRSAWENATPAASDGGSGAPGAPAFQVPNPQDPRLWAQREAIKVALQYPEAAGSYFDGINPDAFTDPAYRAVRDAMAKVGGAANAGASESAGPAWIANVAAEMVDVTGRNFVSELAVEEIHAADPSAYADSVLSRLQEVRVGNQIAQLKSQLQRMRPSDDEMAYNALFSDLVALEQARRELNDRAFRG